jgi:hypothetical protein
MKDVEKFIGFVVGVGFLLATLGTLQEVTMALRHYAAKDLKRGMFSIGAYNRKLTGTGVPGQPRKQ